MCDDFFSGIVTAELRSPFSMSMFLIPHPSSWNKVFIAVFGNSQGLDSELEHVIKVSPAASKGCPFQWELRLSFTLKFFLVVSPKLLSIPLAFLFNLSLATSTYPASPIAWIQSHLGRRMQG